MVTLYMFCFFCFFIVCVGAGNGFLVDGISSKRFAIQFSGLTRSSRAKRNTPPGKNPPYQACTQELVVNADQQDSAVDYCRQ